MSESQRERFARLFIESSAGLRRKIHRLLSSRADADDVVQEAFLRAYEVADTLRVPGAFVYSAARNLAVDIRREEKVLHKIALRNVALSLVESVGEPADAQLLAEERTRLLKEAVERLPRQCRTVFALKIFQGRSYKEIADALGISVRTVENHVARGLRDTHRHLRQRYSGNGGQDD